MFKHVWVPALLSLAAAACSTVDKLGSEPIKPPKPVPAWSNVYTVPYDAMVTCLAAPAGDGFVVNIEPPSTPGTTSVLYVPRSAPQAESRYVVKRVPDGTIQVDWIRIGSVGGLDWLDVQARQRANRCGGLG
ncbi:hypothetical protein LJ725_02580 [Reyranella aquatilis]|uniref:Lipoprotein n=1 Tax=Reyranella aquatilis TaxID=2035356 RepID=A0ABS8KP28_9HYPH|nr:hypothetical protein [Reyranella aquatilis]MCC8427834.1 hypothetical protein [Reyranella aquatilis]